MTATTDNRILAALPDEERQRLERLMHRRTLSIGEVLYEPEQPVTEMYFITSGAVSLMVVMESGQLFEPAIVGREGMLGFPIGLSDDRSRWRSVVLVPGEAYVMRRVDLSAHLREPGNLAPLLIHYAGLLVTFTSVSSACSQFHSLQQRLIRWLLLVHDRADGDEFAMTHDSLGMMLGSYRPSATVALGELQTRGLVSQGRGRIRVLDRGGLEAAACECYERVRLEYAEPVRVDPAFSVGVGGMYSGSSGERSET